MCHCSHCETFYYCPVTCLIIFSGVNFSFFVSISALIDFCPFDELYEVTLDFGLVFSPLDFVFGLVRGATTGSAE